MRILVAIFSYLLCMSWLHGEEPWGKEADLAYFMPGHVLSPEPCKESMIARLGKTLIQFHQDVISPADGPRSHFFPSSSQYTKEAIARYGFFYGVALGCDRLMRENDDPWIYRKVKGNDGLLKYNPIPK